MGPLNAPALAELCWLLEQADTRLLPDAIWLGGKAHLYQHLHSMEALGLTQDAAPSIICPDCTGHSIQPGQHTETEDSRWPYRAYCAECGWVDLTKAQSRLWQANPARIAEWLNAALGLKAQYKVEVAIEGVLWYLGDREVRRQRRSFFFGCRLASAPKAVQAELDRLAAPGAEAVITTSDLALLKTTVLAARHVVPLRAIAHLRKTHLVLENLEAYFTGLTMVQQSDETSLRILHSQQAVLIGGRKVPLSPQVYGFLKVLEEADGDEVHKRHLAQALQIKENFRIADVFKRHREVFDTFVESDQKGNDWLKPEFLILDRG